MDGNVVQRNFRITVLNQNAGIEAGKTVYLLNVLKASINYSKFKEMLKGRLKMPAGYELQILWGSKAIYAESDFFEMWFCSVQDSDGFVNLDVIIIKEDMAGGRGGGGGAGEGSSVSEQEDVILIPDQSPGSSRGKEPALSHPVMNISSEDESEEDSLASQLGTVSIQSGQSKETVLEAAANFASANPFFNVIMRPTYVNEGKMCLPTSFAKKYMKGVLVLTLKVSDGRTWNIKYGSSKGQKQKWLRKGWDEFVSDNQLKVGDACVFELVDMTNFQMIVHIFRVSQS